jgi:CheY-like chemotaxis protein
MTKLNILVVEDDPDLAESVAEALGLGGHNVRLASNGAEAVKCFEEMKYDLSFIDVRMPVMNGVDCFFAIRARYPDAKIVLMTGFKEPAVEKALNAGALALLHKPFRMEEVMKIARQYQ